MIRFNDIPEPIRKRYFWDWTPEMKNSEIDEKDLARELEAKELDFALNSDPQCAEFLNKIGEGLFEYAGFTLDY